MNRGDLTYNDASLALHGLWSFICESNLTLKCPGAVNGGYHITELFALPYIAAPKKGPSLWKRFGYLVDSLRPEVFDKVPPLSLV